jgi:Fe-S-cluster containining protein
MLSQMEILPENDAVKSAAITIALNTLENDHSDQFLLNMMRHLIAFGEHIIDKAETLDADSRIECSCGCSYCCHMQVKVTPPESFLIFAHILETFSTEEIERLKLRIENNRGLTEGCSLHERVLLKKETPCIFLTNHACDIYESRPLICRAWHSLNQNGCRQAFLDRKSVV